MNAVVQDGYGGTEVLHQVLIPGRKLRWSLGAGHVFVYTRQDFSAGTEHYDVIVDSAGSPALSRFRRALTPKGAAVIVGARKAVP